MPNPCPGCADMDWRGIDYRLQHHPDCPVGYKRIEYEKIKQILVDLRETIEALNSIEPFEIPPGFEEKVKAIAREHAMIHTPCFEVESTWGKADTSINIPDTIVRVGIPVRPQQEINIEAHCLKCGQLFKDRVVVSVNPVEGKIDFQVHCSHCQSIHYCRLDPV